MITLSVGHKNDFVSDLLIDFQFKFSLSIGEIVTHWFTLIVLSTLRCSDNENMLGLVILILRSILTDLQETSKGNGGSHNWWNRDLEIIPRGVAWSRKQLFKRSDYSLLFGKDSTVNLDLTPTKSKLQSDWYNFFHEYCTTYVPRSAPTRYPYLFDDYLKKLSASRKHGKLDTKDLPIICRCDTTSVEEIRVKDCVISQLNSCVYKLGTIIKVLGHECKGVLLVREEKKKWRHDLMNLDHWKVSRSKITNGKRSQRSGAFLAYYWGDTFIHVEKDRPLNALNDQDMTQFLKDLTPWVESTFNRRVCIFLGHQGPLRARFPWCKDLLLQDTITLLYVDGSRYNVALSDVDQLWKSSIDDYNFILSYGIRKSVNTSFLVSYYIVSTDIWIRLQKLPSAVLRIKHVGQAVIGNNLVVLANYLVGEGRLLCGWLLGVDGYSATSYRMVVSVNTPYFSKLVGFNNDDEPIIKDDDTGYQMDTTLQVYNPIQGEFQNMVVDADPCSFFVGPIKE
nr:phospholipase-like protein [Tanacetum cinerariifolium]